MRILIIGGGGFIGYRLFSDLSLEYDVTIEDNGFNGIIKTRDVDALSPAYLNYFDRIIYLAGYASVGSCEKYKNESYEENVSKFSRFLDKLKDFEGILYYASSALVYGNRPNLSREDDELCTPIQNYDSQKIEIEKLARNSNIRSVALRLGTVCGYSLNLRTDTVINSMVESSINNGYIKISSPNTRRSILSLKDLSDFIVDNIHKEAHTPILNIGSFNSSIGEIGNKVGRYVRSIVKIDDNNLPSLYDFYLDLSLVKKVYGWKPSCNIDYIVEELLNNRKHLKKAGR